MIFKIGDLVWLKAPALYTYECRDAWGFGVVVSAVDLDGRNKVYWINKNSFHSEPVLGIERVP